MGGSSHRPEAKRARREGAGQTLVSGSVGLGGAAPRLGGLGLFAAAFPILLLAAGQNLGAGLGSDPTPSTFGSGPASASASAAPVGTIDTTEPSPSSVVTLPTVEPSVDGRPGVPPALYDRYWTLGRQAGHVGTTARIVVPADEMIVAAAGGLVASIAVDQNHQPLVGSNGVAVVVRDIRTGAVRRTVETGIYATQFILIHSVLMWGGVALPNEASFGDAGVSALDLGDPASTARTVIPARDLTATYGSHASRGLLRVTDRGRSVITLVEGEALRATEIIDVSTLTLRATLDGEFALEVMDGLAIISPLARDRDGPARSKRVRLLDLTTGREIGSGLETTLVRSSVGGEGEVFVQYSLDSVSYISAISIESGDSRTLREVSAETHHLSRDLSAPQMLALLPIEAEGLDTLPVSVLHTETGRLESDLFFIGTPRAAN